MKKLTILLSLISVIEIHSQEPIDQQDLAKEVIREWVHVEKLLAKEKSDWKREQAESRALLKLYANELAILDQHLAAVPSVEMDDDKKEKLETQIKSEDKKRRQLFAFLVKQKPRVIALAKRFPEPLREQIADTLDLLRSEDKELSARLLLEPMMSVIEAGNSFNSGVYRSSQKIRIGSEEWQAQVIYLGLGRAFFWVGDVAGIGEPGSGTDGGWEWRRDDSQLEDIKKAMSVFDKTTQPQLIKLPLQIN